MVRTPVLRIPCADADAAFGFARYLRLREFKDFTCTGTEVAITTGDHRLAFELARNAIEGKWVDEDTVDRATSDYLTARSEALRDHSADYLLWCHERGQWWKAARRGYTSDLAEAGTYSEQQALEICDEAAYRWRLGDGATAPPEVAIPYTEDDQAAQVAVIEATRAAHAAHPAAAGKRA